MSGYTVPQHIRHEFPELGEDIWVVVRNTALMPQNRLIPPSLPESDQKGREILAAKWFASFVLDWRIPDPANPEADDQLLGEPSAETYQQLPIGVSRWIQEQVNSVFL